MLLLVEQTSSFLLVAAVVEIAVQLGAIVRGDRFLYFFLYCCHLSVLLLYFVFVGVFKFLIG